MWGDEFGMCTDKFGIPWMVNIGAAAGLTRRDPSGRLRCELRSHRPPLYHPWGTLVRVEMAAVWGLVETVAAVDPSCRDRDQLCAAVAAGARLRAWLDGRDVQLAAQLAEVASFPEQAIAQAARSSLRDAGRVLDRARTAQAMPPLGDALAAGTVSGGHVDVIGRALRQLEPHQRPRLAATGPTAGRRRRGEQPRGAVPGGGRRGAPDPTRRRHRPLGAPTASHPAAQLGRRGGHVVPHRPLRPRNRPRSPRPPGRHHRHPVHRLGPRRLPRRPPGTPRVPPRPRPGRPHPRSRRRRGATGGGRGGRHHHPRRHRCPHHRLGTPRRTPHRPSSTASSLWPTSTPSSCTDGVVLHAPGQLDLGRSTRLANRAQRRTLRALYPTCAIPGCTTRYDLCKLHHIHWWEHGGPTDLHNLLPLCVTHHHAVHDRHWQLNLTPNRQLTITYPDGATTPHRTTSTPATTRLRPDAGLYRHPPRPTHHAVADMSPPEHRLSHSATHHAASSEGMA